MISSTREYMEPEKDGSSFSFRTCTVGGFKCKNKTMQDSSR